MTTLPSVPVKMDTDMLQNIDAVCGLVRTAYLATLDAGFFDDDALTAMREVLNLTLNRVDPLRDTLYAMHNTMCEQSWTDHKRGQS